MRPAIGEPLPHEEDRRLTAGRGRYLDDRAFPQAAHGVVLRSPHAHADVVHIDATAARSAPGVLAIYLAADWIASGLGGPRVKLARTRPDGTPMFAPARPVLVGDRVRYVGDPVAFVVAETLNQARDAAELIDVEYEPINCVTDVVEASAPNAIPVWDGCPDNISNMVRHGDAGRTEAVFSGATHVVERRYRITRVYAQFLETRGAVGEYDAATDRLTLFADVQYPHRVRAMLAEDVFRCPLNKVRVVTDDVGGAFGAKGWQYVEHRLVLFAARELNRTVKWASDRSEAVMADEHGRDSVADVALALDASFQFLALRVRMLANIGAYVGSDRNLLAPFNNMTLACGVYAFEAAQVDVIGVLSNTNPTAPYRGAGRPEAAYVIERIIDDAARDLGVDRLDLRRRNTLATGSFPHQTPLGLKYDCGDFSGNLEAALALADAGGFETRRLASARVGRLRGLGVANVVEHAGGSNVPEYAEVRLDPSGHATLLAGTKAQGQGHETMYKQIVGDVLGLDASDMSFIDGDTDLVSFGMGTNSSRSVVIGGSAMLLAARKVSEKATVLAAHMLGEGSAVLEDGHFVAPSGRRVHFRDVVRASYQSRSLPAGMEPGLSASAMFAASQETFPTGCHVCEVEIDPRTGIVHLDRYSVVDDVGRVINPVGVKTQIQGGIVQGLGQVLMEHLQWEPESGQLLTANFLTYAMPKAHHTCSITIQSRPTLTQTNPLGAKGAGESGTVGALPAVMNAVLDALAQRGVTDFDMPATPDRIWRALGCPTILD